MNLHSFACPSPLRSPLALAGLLVTVGLASACVVPMAVGNGVDDGATGGGDGETDDPGATSMDDGASETAGAEQYPDCAAPTAANATLALSVDGVLYDPWMPPDDLLFATEGVCTVTSALETGLALECPDLGGQAHTIELGVEATPAVALPPAGTVVYMSYYLETDDLSDRLGGWVITLREGSADGALLLLVNGAFTVVVYGLDLESSLGPSDLCPPQEVDGCFAYRRTWVSVGVDGTTLEAFDHASIDVDGLRMVVGDAEYRTGVMSDECGGGGLGPGFGRFELVIGPPA